MDQKWTLKKAKNLRRGMIIAEGRYAREIADVGQAKRNRIRVVLFSTQSKDQSDINHPAEWLELHPDADMEVAVSGVNHFNYVDRTALVEGT